MTVRDFDSRELTKEKRLWDIYRAAWAIRSSRFNVAITASVFLLLVLHVSYSDQPISEMLSFTRRMAEAGLGLSLNTLGFLIAGFTIFATISQPGLSLRMAEIRNPESGLSYLKHNYFIFLRVFIYYLVFAAFSLFVVVFGGPRGLAATLAAKSACHQEIRVFLARASFVLLFTGYFFLIVQLKSFVFNIYHSVMTALRWKAEGYE